MFELEDMTKSAMWNNTVCGPSENGSDDLTNEEIANDYGVDEYNDCGPADGNW